MIGITGVMILRQALPGLFWGVLLRGCIETVAGWQIVVGKENGLVAIAQRLRDAVGFRFKFRRK